MMCEKMAIRLTNAQKRKITKRFLSKIPDMESFLKMEREESRVMIEEGLNREAKLLFKGRRK